MFCLIVESNNLSLKIDFKAFLISLFTVVAESIVTKQPLNIKFGLNSSFISSILSNKYSKPSKANLSIFIGTITSSLATNALIVVID